MDHLPLPHNARSPLPRCPLLCDPDDIPDCEFEDYPLLAQPRPYWRRALSIDGTQSFRELEYSAPSPTHDLESFLQAWLFFCLWRNVLRTVVPFTITDYISHGDDGVVVVIRSDLLVKHLSSWDHTFERLSNADKAIVVSRLQSWLQLIEHALAAIRSHGSFNTDLRMSFEGSLDLLAEIAWDKAGSGPRYTYMSGFFLTTEMRTRMLEQGWCPFEIASVRKSFSSSAFYLYLSRMRLIDSAGLHQHCTENNCSVATTNLADYKPAHVNDMCDCELIRTPIGEVEQCLMSDSFPILELTQAGDVKVVQYEDSLPYVALSHCWADGLGNPASMSLPRCQLIRLAAMIDMVQHKRFYGDTGVQPDDRSSEERYTKTKRLFLWCDTLCCPVDGPLKLRAIGKLKKVYEKAAYGLVLERSLESFNAADINALEAAIRIACSKWFFRGWTLQEAGLPGKLVFKFAHTIVDIDEITDHLGRYWEEYPGIRPQINRAFNVCRSIRLWASGQSSLDFQRSITLTLLNFQQRRLSVASDEALCLSTLLGVDNDAVAQSSARMETLWKLVSATKYGVSQSMILNTLPRLTTPGYRWAPSTVIGSEDTASFFGHFGDVKGTLTDKGLLVNSSAWVLSKAVLPLGVRPNMITSGSDMSRAGNVLLQSPAGKWHVLAPSMPQLQAATDRPNLMDLLTDSSRVWYVVFEAKKNDERSSSVSYRLRWRALLAYVERYEGDIPVLRSVWPVAVMITPHETMFKLAYIGAELLRRSWFCRCIAAISRCEQLCHTVVRYNGLATGARSLWCLRFIRAVVERHFEACLHIIVNSICSSTNTTDEGLKDTVVDFFMSRCADVIATFPESQQYYVD